MAKASLLNIRFVAGESAGVVSGLILRPRQARALLILAHGAGAGMRHRFMEDICAKLTDLAIATFRYQFPYMEKRTKRPDPERVLTATVRAAVTAAKKRAPDLPLFAGGKSMGGRMTSLAAAEKPLEGVRGLIFLGFPLHAAGKPSSERANHLPKVSVPTLFLQGSRDTLADIKLLKPICRQLGGQCELCVIEGGDHSFHMLKSSGRSDDAALEEVARRIADWIST